MNKLFKNAAIVAMSGFLAFSISACGQNSDTVNETTNESTPSKTETVAPSAPTETYDMSSFDYDFNNVSIDDKIKEEYGEKASENILESGFTPMAIMTTNKSVYSKGKKTADVYLPLKAHMTPEGWERDSKKFNKDEDGSVFPAMAINCDVNGQTPILKKGKKGTDNKENYKKLNCDEEQPIDNTKLLNLKVGTYKSEKGDKQFVDVSQHVTVSGTKEQTYTGTDSKGEPQWQTMNIDFTLYLIPDSNKKDHWLIDTAGWSYGFGESSYNSK